MTLREKAAAWDKHVARRKAYDLKPDQVAKRHVYETSEKRKARKRTPEYKAWYNAYAKEWRAKHRLKHKK